MLLADIRMSSLLCCFVYVIVAFGNYFAPVDVTTYAGVVESLVVSRYLMRRVVSVIVSIVDASMPTRVVNRLQGVCM